MLVTMKESTLFWLGTHCKTLEAGHEYDLPECDVDNLMRRGKVERPMNFHPDAPEWYTETVRTLWNGEWR